MKNNQNLRRLTINPTTNYSDYVEAIQASGIEANWHEKMFLQNPQHLEAMSLALVLSQNEISHYFKHEIGNSPLKEATLDPSFAYFSKENQEAIINYVNASLANAKYHYYPEAYGPCPEIPTFKLDFPFASDNDESSILITLNPYMEKSSSSADAHEMI